jgi:hypothetical protein
MIGSSLLGIPLSDLKPADLVHLYAYLVNAYGENHTPCFEVLDVVRGLRSQDDLQKAYDSGYNEGYNKAMLDGFADGYAKALEDYKCKQ